MLQMKKNNKLGKYCIHHSRNLRHRSNIATKMQASSLRRNASIAGQQAIASLEEESKALGLTLMEYPPDQLNLVADPMR